MSIELLLFCVVLVLTAICLLLSILVVRNHAQIREIRGLVARLEARTAVAPEPLEAELEMAAPGPPGLRLIRPADLEAEVRALAGEGKVLEAVQRYSHQTGVSLRAAHAAVRDILES